MGTHEATLTRIVRGLARAGVAPSNMLREVVRRVGHGRADRQYLVRLVSDAFHFREGEGHVIFGWQPDGSGELTDAQLDHHLGKRIQAARPAWDGVP